MEETDGGIREYKRIGLLEYARIRSASRVGEPARMRRRFPFEMLLSNRNFAVKSLTALIALKGDNNEDF
jgi:hypothetical protein